LRDYVDLHSRDYVDSVDLHMQSTYICSLHSRDCVNLHSRFDYIDLRDYVDLHSRDYVDYDESRDYVDLRDYVARST